MKIAADCTLNDMIGSWATEIFGQACNEFEAVDLCHEYLDGSDISDSEVLNLLKNSVASLYEIQPNKGSI